MLITHYVQKDHCDATQLDDEWLILNTANYSITKLNEVGGFCWSLLNDSQTVDSLIQAIDNDFESKIEIIEKDIEEFLSDLIQCGLIQHGK